MQCNKMRLAALVQQLEGRGCVIQHDHNTRSQASSVLALVPGVDQWCPLPEGSIGAVLQRLFWNQIEFRLNEKSGKISASWNYTSLSSLFIHGTVSVMVALCSLGRVGLIDGILILTAANSVPFIAAYLETRSILKLVGKLEE
ncbi:MAG: hypothetical protein ACJ763_16515 [Bdellovibrionia bacterium]